MWGQSKVFSWRSNLMLVCRGHTRDSLVSLVSIAWLRYYICNCLIEILHLYISISGLRKKSNHIHQYLSVQLLQKLHITASGKGEKLLRVIKNPVTQYLPINSRKIGEPYDLYWLVYQVFFIPIFSYLVLLLGIRFLTQFRKIGWCAQLCRYYQQRIGSSLCGTSKCSSVLLVPHFFHFLMFDSFTLICHVLVYSIDRLGQWLTGKLMISMSKIIFQVSNLFSLTSVKTLTQFSISLYNSVLICLCAECCISIIL